MSKKDSINSSDHSSSPNTWAAFECTECGTIICPTSRDKKCPNCGTPLPINKKEKVYA